MKVAIYSRGLDADLKAQLIILIGELQKHEIKITLLQSLADIDINVVEKGLNFLQPQLI